MGTIEINHVSKTINNSQILSNISCKFESGNIYGLIGRNGSGKTMLMRVICGLALPTEGEILIDGKKLGRDMEMPSSIGAIIETPGFLLEKSGLQNLRYLAALRNVICEDEIKRAMIACGLDPADKKHVRKYSLGMRQRLGIAQAIMENPDILILDEPMNGLDNQGVEDIKQLLKNLRRQNKIIIIASHHMEDISELCDVVYSMDNGQLS